MILLRPTTKSLRFPADAPIYLLPFMTMRSRGSSRIADWIMAVVAHLVWPPACAWYRRAQPSSDPPMSRPYQRARRTSGRCGTKCTRSDRAATDLIWHHTLEFIQHAAAIAVVRNKLRVARGIRTQPGERGARGRQGAADYREQSGAPPGFRGVLS
jgi:hypothetical protein